MRLIPSFFRENREDSAQRLLSSLGRTGRLSAQRLFSFLWENREDSAQRLFPLP